MSDLTCLCGHTHDHHKADYQALTFGCDQCWCRGFRFPPRPFTTRQRAKIITIAVLIVAGLIALYSYAFDHPTPGPMEKQPPWGQPDF